MFHVTVRCTDYIDDWKDFSQNKKIVFLLMFLKREARENYVGVRNEKLIQITGGDCLHQCDTWKLEFYAERCTA